MEALYRPRLGRLNTGSSVALAGGGKQQWRLKVLNTSSGQQQQPKALRPVVVMVDPLEAKRLAAEEMKRLQARARVKRRQWIEAVNGGWAMVGLTAGLVIEGYTGKTIPEQVKGYVESFSNLFHVKLPFS